MILIDFFTAINKNLVKKVYLFSFCVEFIAHTQILTPLSSFYHKILSNWLKFVGFVAFASFDETLSITHKKIIDKSFFSWVISNRKAVSFLWFAV